MDDSYRMRLKIGTHEFEAEGPVAVVQEQVKRFMELIASLPVDYIKESAAPFPGVESREYPVAPSAAQTPPPPSSANTDISLLEKIMKMENRIISLTARPESPEAAVLLLLYGQKALRQNDGVTGAEVMDGITATGGLSIQRVDRLLEKLGRDGDVIVIGERRGKRYRLTNAGLAKAKATANALIAIVA